MTHCLASGAVRVVECIIFNSEVNKTHTHTFTVCPESYCTCIIGERCCIYIQLPAESDSGELQKLLKLLPTIFSANLISPKHRFTNSVPS